MRPIPTPFCLLIDGQSSFHHKYLSRRLYVSAECLPFLCGNKRRQRLIHAARSGASTATSGIKWIDFISHSPLLHQQTVYLVWKWKHAKAPISNRERTSKIIPPLQASTKLEPFWPRTWLLAGSLRRPKHANYVKTSVSFLKHAWLLALDRQESAKIECLFVLLGVRLLLSQRLTYTSLITPQITRKVDLGVQKTPLQVNFYRLWNCDFIKKISSTWFVFFVGIVSSSVGLKYVSANFVQSQRIINIFLEISSY